MDGTCRTQTFCHVIDVVQLVARWQLYGGYGHIGDAERTVTAFTVEVNVLVVILVVAVVAVAQLVTHAVATVLDDMNQMVLAEQRQRRAELEQDIAEIQNILKKGTEQAREVGAQTMDEVRRAMRIDYFNDTTMWKL